MGKSSNRKVFSFFSFRFWHETRFGLMIISIIAQVLLTSVPMDTAPSAINQAQFQALAETSSVENAFLPGQRK